MAFDALRPPSRPLRMAIVNAPPFEFFSPDGRPGGFSVDLMNAAAARSGISIEWVLAPPDPEHMLPAGEVDLWASLSVTEERLKHFYMTEPYIRNEFCLISRARKEVANEWTATPVDTRGRIVSIPDTPIRERQARSLMPHAKLLVSATREGVAQNVCQGRADYGFLEVRVAYSNALRRQPGCETQNLEIIPMHDAVIPVAMGAAPGAIRYADRLRAEISAMAADGTLGPIYAKWLVGSGTNIEGFVDITRGERRERLLSIAVVLLSALLAATVFLVISLRAARRAAEKASLAKSQFLANMNHEMRTPLNGVIGMTTLLSDTPLASDQREYVGTIQSSSTLLLALVNDVLDFSKIEAGKLQLETAAFELRPLLNECLQLMSQGAARKGLELRLEVDPSMPATLEGDAIRLRQILINLLSNAVKFTPAGEVRLSAAGVGSRVRFEVADTGVGIEPDVSRRLFEAFTQADASTTRRYGGTGLGLAITKRLVELMGGEIQVETHPGAGSRFWFEIPLPAGTAVPVNAALPEVRFEARVLVAEDNPVNQRIAALLLRRFGCEVDLAWNGKEAVALAGRNAYAAIFMDCHMPEMDGYEATRIIRAHDGPNTRTAIVAITGNAVQGDREACLAAGMDDYLKKPLELPALQAILEQWLAKPSAACCS
jgi:signal transduction histidine kinase/CheY-like chemotaxis protein